ncbi:MAG: hypothetical protein FWC43_10760 [Planctomycetaceae bacterium]|nr:hypothetical protein [Planctomycetaceae bacterium]
MFPVEAGENFPSEVRALPEAVVSLPSTVSTLPPVDGPARTVDETGVFNPPEKRTLVFSKVKQEEEPSALKLGSSGPTLKIFPQVPTLANTTETAEIAARSVNDGEIIVAQWGFLRPDGGKEDRPFLNAETRPFSQPQKAAEVSSSFVVDSERQVDQNVIRNADQPVKINPNSVGNPNSAVLVRMMYDEMVKGLQTRQITDRYNKYFREYCGRILDQYASPNIGGERNGRARLPWYGHSGKPGIPPGGLYRDPMKSVIEVEEFSRTIHAGLIGDHRYLAETLAIIREKLDIFPAKNNTIQWSKAKTPQEAVADVKRCVVNAKAAYTRAISTLSSAELRELETTLYPIFCGEVTSGHTIPKRSVGKRLIDIMQRMDRTGIHDAVDALVPLTDERFLRLLKTLPEDAFPQVRLGSQRVQKITTTAGDIIIGGRGNNDYDLDAPEMQDVICVIDLGGNDIYREGSCNLGRPVFVIIDLGGDDTYIGSRPGIQAGSILGVSMLLDLEGNDTYEAKDIAQGSTIGGAGILIDYSGNDKYRAIKRGQGTALMGVGLLLDKGGDDQYRAALFGQGLGHPGGFGVLEDCSGNDKYYIGGLYLNSYQGEQPGYDGWGQGIGAGIRDCSNGGIGMLLDGGGDDTYEYDFFAHGGGYWFGVGVARDFGGDDKRLGATLLDYYGKPRSQARSQRFCCGFGCHYALGFLFDDFGNDSYDGTIMGVGMAWDLSAGFLCDFAGNDRYEAKGNMTQGVGAQAGIGVLFDYDGNDVYMGSSHGYAASSMSYHDPKDAGSNFSFLIDYGGNDTYGARGVTNNTYIQRGGSGGFLIDRPFDTEVAAEKAAAEKAATEKAESKEAPKPTTPNRQPARPR